MLLYYHLREGFAFLRKSRFADLTVHRTVFNTAHFESPSNKNNNSGTIGTAIVIWKYDMILLSYIF